MKILLVIHGFPPYYMAGSEVYAYNLSIELARNNMVYVFSRIENEFERQYSEIDEVIDGIRVHRVNKWKGDYNLRDKYVDEKMDDIFRSYIDKVNPDIVHIQHLSHLSTNIVSIAKNYGLPIVFTIHDFWMFCPRGQLLTPEYELCSLPDKERCVSCLSYLHTTMDDINEYIKHMHDILDKIDIFVSPSKYLMSFYHSMGIDPRKTVYSRYGFIKGRIKYRKKIYREWDHINFGYIGRIIPAKGIHLLIKAFSSINKENITLKIYGTTGKNRYYLEKIAKNSNILFMEGFDNRNIDYILNSIDVLVVPSIWYENSPLVIQEAFMKGIPVITSNIGGMAELVKDGINGFLFTPGDIESLKGKILAIAQNPSILNNVNPIPDDVQDIHEDVRHLENIYRRLL
ncbi:MAG: glycosyltransferase family 4 protein [Thermoplasmata archaeon]